jgi:hypothetical protein
MAFMAVQLFLAAKNYSLTEDIAGIIDVEPINVPRIDSMMTPSCLCSGFTEYFTPQWILHHPWHRPLTRYDIPCFPDVGVFHVWAFVERPGLREPGG